MKPNFLILGAARSGTSFLQKNLQAHPEIFMPERKELHFFDKEEDYNKGIDYYNEYFKEATPSIHKAVGEATPAYFHTNTVPWRLKKHFPEMKFVLILRNPVDRAYSHYLKLSASQPKFRNMTFEEAIEDAPAFVEHGYYHKFLEKYYLLYSKSNFFVLIFEELFEKRKDGLDGLEGIFKFLGVTEDFQSRWRHVRFNSADTYIAKSKLKITGLLSRLFIGNRFGGPNLAAFFDKKLKSSAPISTSTRLKLTDHFREYNNKLAFLLDRSLNIWEQ